MRFGVSASVAVALLFIYNLYFTSQRGPVAAGTDAKRCRSSGSLKERRASTGGGAQHAPLSQGLLPQGGTGLGSKALFKDSSS